MSSSKLPASSAGRRRGTDREKGAPQRSLLVTHPEPSGLCGRLLGGDVLLAAVALPVRAFLHAQVVLHVADARNVVDAVFGATLLLAASDSAVERDLALVDRDPARRCIRISVRWSTIRATEAFPGPAQPSGGRAIRRKGLIASPRAGRSGSGHEAGSSREMRKLIASAAGALARRTSS